MMYKNVICIGFMFISSLNHAMMPRVPRVKNNHQKRAYCTESRPLNYKIETLNTRIYNPETGFKYPAHVVAVQQHFQHELEKEATSAMNVLCAFWKVTPEQLKQKFAQEAYLKLKKQQHFSPVSKRLENRVRAHLESEFKSIDVGDIGVLGLDHYSSLSLMAGVTENSISFLFCYEDEKYKIHTSGADQLLKMHVEQAMGHLAHQDYVIPRDGADNIDFRGYDWTRVLPDDVEHFLCKRAKIWAWTRSPERALSAVSFYRKLYPDAVPHTKCEDQAFDCKMLTNAEQVYTMLSDELLNEREGG